MILRLCNVDVKKCLNQKKNILTSCKILRNFCKYDLIEITSWISTKLLASLLLLLPQLLHMVDPTPLLLSFCKNKNNSMLNPVVCYKLIPSRKLEEWKLGQSCSLNFGKALHLPAVFCYKMIACSTCFY